MNSHFILFAADWTDVIVPVVVFAIWLINQIAGAKNKAGAQPNRPKPPQPAQPAAGQRGLMDEVEQFLKDARKAMEQQKQAPRNPPAAPKPPPLRAQQPPQQKPKQKPPKKPQQQRGGRAVPAEKLDLKSKLEQRERDDVERGDSVSEHVRQHLDTSRFEERAGRLSHLQQQVETDIDAHVHSAFDHQVGTLASQTGTRIDAQGAAMTTDDSATGPNSVVQIVAMLRDPQSMRNAIILQEILAPPTHRW